MTTSTRKSLLIAALSSVALVVASVVVHAAFSATNMTDDIVDSCENFSISTDGVLTATCNRWEYGHTDCADRTTTCVTGTYTDTIDLDERVGTIRGNLTLDLTGTRSNFTSTCDSSSFSVGVNSEDELDLEATCTYNGTQVTSSTRLCYGVLNRGFKISNDDPDHLSWRR